jgi:hypothetical protein
LFSRGYTRAMHRFGMAELRRSALAALDEVADRSKDAPVERTLALRFTLAFLANFADHREPFDYFWRALTTKKEIGRVQNVRAALNGIRRAVGE